MRNIALALLLAVPAGPLQAGRALKIYGNGFAFLVTEPEGWTIDVESAAQIANLVMYESGKTWREAEVVVFVRFVDRTRNETLEEFVKLDGSEFEQTCPFYEAEEIRLELQGQPQQFVTKAYHCPGYKEQVVAFTELPGRFGVFLLSAKKKEAVSAGLEPFKELLSSFQWLGDTGWRIRTRRQ